MVTNCDSNEMDWVANKTQFTLAWGLPTALLVGSWFLEFSSLLMGGLWMLGLSWMGFACLRNASHCGRMHCFFSGPYFILSGIVALGIGFKWPSLQSVDFTGLGLFLIIATPMVCVLPELLWGTYKRRNEG